MIDQMLDAAQKGDLPKVTSLLDSGFNVNTANPHGVTALLRAVMFGHLDICKLLITRGARLATAHGLPTLLVAVQSMRADAARHRIG